MTQDWQLYDISAADHRAALGGVLLQLDDLGGDMNRFSLCPNLQRDVERKDLPYLDHHPGMEIFLETGLLGGNVVGSRAQEWDRIIPTRVRHDRGAQVGGDVGGRHGDARYHTAG